MNLKTNDSLGGRGKLALTFILFNEEKSIEEAIKAFWYKGIPIYDLLVIGIDNKTTDNTEEIVKKYCLPENLFHFDFNDDFGASRNIALKMIEKTDVDWVMFPDGHEILRPESLPAVKYFVDNIDVEKQGVEIWLLSPYIEVDVDEYGIPDVVFPRPFFFKNKKGLFFNRKVHNYLDAPGKKAHAPDIRFIHNMPHDRQKERKIQRKEMNIPELTRSAESGDVRDLFFLGNAYFETEDNEKAAELYGKLLDIINLKDTDMACQVAITQACCYQKLEKYEEARTSCMLAINNRWDRAEPYFYLGFMASNKAFNAGKNDRDNPEHIQCLAEAEHWFNIMTTLSMPQTIYFLQGKHYTWYPWDALADIRNRLGDIEGAIEATKKVLEYKKDNPASLENLRKLEAGLTKRKNPGMVDIGTQVSCDAGMDPF